MKKLKKKHLFRMGIPVVIATCVFSIVNISKQNTPILNHEFVIDLSEKNYRKVYLLDENKYLIPLSIDVSSKEHLVDEIYTVVSNLRDLEIEGFNSVIARDVKINKIELENGILNIDFSKEFLTYQADLEEKIIESLTWSVMDFDEVNGLTISVDGVKLEQMPLNGLHLPSILNKDIGINKYHDLMNNYQNSDDIVVMYQKQINDQTYYVPVTRRVDRQENDTMTVMRALDKDISLLSGLSQIEYLRNMDVNKITYMDSKVSVNLSNDYLIEDNLIDSEIYELLLVTFEYNNMDAKVDFYVNEESVTVNGYNNQEQEKVSNVIFNEIEI